MGSRRTISLLVIAATFLFGGLTGAGVMTLVFERRIKPAFLEGNRPGSRLVTVMVGRQLGLSDQQKARVATILDGAARERQQVEKAIRPQLSAVRARMIQQVRAELTDEQRPKLDQLLARLRAERLRAGNSPDVVAE